MRSHLSIRATASLMAACWVVGVISSPAIARQFASHKVSLNAWIDLNTFGAGSGNDCWGYVSPSGREYALMGLSNKVAFVEITDPNNPDWFASINHTNNLWGDVAVYGSVAYAVTETTTGIQVIDMSDIDNHVVTLVRTINSPSRSHNIATNADSGFLYTTGSRGGSARQVIFDLNADPLNPVQIGIWDGAYEHDVHVVNYTEGPFAGREIMFGSSEGRGLDVVDVTDKSNTFLMSRTTYPNLTYCHQSWTEDFHYLFINDELDSIPRTIVMDISDLNAPVYIGEFTNGTQAIDHNNYVCDGILYAANYHAGMRMFDVAADPVNPVQIGWFDTFPADDSGGFDGAWSVFPFFPSGTVIVSDMNRGLFVLDVSEALGGTLIFARPNGLPEFIDPAGGTAVRVEVSGDGNVAPQPGTGRFFYDAGAGFVEGQMNQVSDNVYDAVFPAIDCGTQVSFYFSAEDTGANVFTDPVDAPASSYHTVSAIGVVIAFADNFESDLGWTVENLGATSGDWQRGVPVNDPNWEYDPMADSDGSGSCFLTQNEIGNTDVDDGAVRLTSPTIDMSAGGMSITYDYYLRLTRPEDNTDVMLVEIDSNGGGGPWTEIARHATDNGLVWTRNEITPADLQAAGVTMTSTMRLRFTVDDAEQQSIVESGLDAFEVSSLDCGATCDPCDMNCDGVINAFDIEPFLGILFDGDTPCDSCTGDANNDGTVDAFDIEPFLNCLFP